MEKSHTKRWQRVTIFIIAMLFVVTSAALTIAVVLQATSGDNNSNKDTAANAQTCTIGLTSGQALPAPAVYQPSGDVTKLQTKDLEPGSGQAAKAGDCLVVKYYGTLAKSGKLFDEDFTQSSALKFQLGKGQVIPGWDVGLAGLKVGGVRRLVIPSDLAYGKAGSPPAIPANADLVFVVKLLKIT